MFAPMLNIVSVLIGLVTLVLGLIAFVPLLGWMNWLVIPLGIVGAAAGSRFARALLFGVAPQDPVTLVTAVALLLVVVVAASWLPARRAALIDPGRALRM